VIQAGHGLLQLGSCKIVSASLYHLFICLTFRLSFHLVVEDVDVDVSASHGSVGEDS